MTIIQLPREASRYLKELGFSLDELNHEANFMILFGDDVHLVNFPDFRGAPFRVQTYDVQRNTLNQWFTSTLPKQARDFRLSKWTMEQVIEYGKFDSEGLVNLFTDYAYGEPKPLGIPYGKHEGQKQDWHDDLFLWLQALCRTDLDGDQISKALLALDIDVSGLKIVRNYLTKGLHFSRVGETQEATSAISFEEVVTDVIPYLW